MLGFTKLEVQTYLILSVAGGLQLFINQIEQPYARSLVTCETPLNATAGAEPSGSSHCGDRLHVIGDGARLSGGGESLESIGRFLITLFVSGFADSHGRKAAALVGWVLITASVAAFFLASFVPGWARVLFILAQGLQGMSGIGLIGDIVVRDIGATIEGDTTGFYNRKNMVGMVVGLLFFLMVMVVQHSQITEFRPVWGTIFLTTVVVMLALIFAFPETQAEEQRKRRDDLSLTGIVRDELGTYRRIVSNNAYIRFAMVESFFATAAGGFMSIFGPWIMATFALNQFQVMILMLPMAILGIFCSPIIPALCTKYGHRRVWRYVFYIDRILEWVCLPLLTATIFGAPFPIFFAYLRLPLGGVMSLHESIETKLVARDESAKYVAIKQLETFFVGSMSALMFSRVFNAEATSLPLKVAPFILSSCLRLGGVFVFFAGWGEQCMMACDMIAADASKEAEAKKTEGEEPQADKKSD